MNSEFPLTLPEELETRITAQLLGELPTAEAVDVRAALAASLELQRLHDQVRQTIELMNQAVPSEIGLAPNADLRLSPDRRRVLLEKFQKTLPEACPARVLPQVPGRRPLPWYWPMALAATLMLALTVTNLESWSGILIEGNASSSADYGATFFSRNLTANGRPVFDAARRLALAAEVSAKSATERRSYIFSESRIAGSPAEVPRTESVALGMVANRAVTPMPASGQGGREADAGDALVSETIAEVKPSAPTAPDPVSLESVARATPEKTVSFGLAGVPITSDAPQLGRRFDENASGAGFGDARVSLADDSARLGSDKKDLSDRAGLARDSLGSTRGGPVLRQLTRPEELNFAQVQSEPVVSVGGGIIGGVGHARQSPVDSIDVLAKSMTKLAERKMENGAFETTLPPAAATKLEVMPSLGYAAVETKTALDPAAQRFAAPQVKVMAFTALPASVPVAADLPTQGLAATNRPSPAAPQPEVAAEQNAVSTFSLNVTDVSFKLAAASLEKGALPEPASIRSEEFINAFKYRDPDAAPGMPIAFNWERAQYPFAHHRELLRLAIRTAARGRESGRPLNLVLLLDNSGSMERADRVAIRREALRVLATQLQAQDRISVVTFARTPRLWVDALAGDQAGTLTERVGDLTPEGGTNLEEALNLAYATAARHYLGAGVNRVVLMTDGAANLGDVSPDSLQRKVESWRQRGVALDCFGIGWEGLNDDLLEVLARHGDGRYGFVNTPVEATENFSAQLAGALHVAAADVKLQVEFHPQRVSVWRQVGYAKHQLTTAQFRDNTVDAAELAAAESGNALYVVEVREDGSGPLATVRARFRDPQSGGFRELEWPVPYQGPARSLEQSPASLRLAATASAFSEWLAGSPFAAEVTPDRLLKLLAGVPAAFDPDPAPVQLEWMIRQAKLVSGK